MKRRGFFSLLLAPFLARSEPKCYQPYPLLRSNIWTPCEPLTEARMIEYFKVVGSWRI
jgi:hypothetical protein